MGPVLGLRQVFFIGLVFSLAVAPCPGWAWSQGPVPGSRQTAGKDDASPEEAEVQEVGGRLVISSEVITVVGDPDLPVRDSSLATKTDTPLLETPRSVSIVDRQMLDDIQAIDISQAHDYTVGFMPADDRGPAFSRGFRVGFYDLRRDGLRTYTWSVREPVGLDRVQYLRGPAALLYGDGSPGGVVNLILKKPLPMPRYEASVGVGELGYRRLTADVTGPLSASRSARYRVVGAAEGLDNGFSNDERRVTILPMVAFDFGPKVTLTLDGEYYDQRGRGYWHFVPATPDTQRGDFSALPWDLNVAGPEDEWNGWNASGGALLDVRFSESAQLHSAVRYTRIDGDLFTHGLSGVAPDDISLQRYLYREISRWDEYQSDTFAAFSFGTGSIAHKLVAGFEAGLSTVKSGIGVGAAPPLELTRPVHGPRGLQPVLVETGSDLTRFGTYVQDQISIGHRLTIVPGVRFSIVRLEDRAQAATQAENGQTTEHVVNPAFGAVFLPMPGLSLYGSFSEGFEPPPPGQYQEDGRALAPVESRSIEGGIKAELLNRRLNLSASWFGIRQSNVVEADARGFYQQIAKGESQGIELEAVGNPLPGLVITGGYAWMRTEVLRDLAGFTGNSLPNAPARQGNLWVRYRFIGGPFSPLSLGAGVVHVAPRFTNRANSVTIPAYTRVDATVSYAVLDRRLGIVVACQNLTNERYATSGAGAVFYAGAPRRLSVTFTTLF